VTKKAGRPKRSYDLKEEKNEDSDEEEEEVALEEEENVWTGTTSHGNLFWRYRNSEHNRINKMQQWNKHYFVPIQEAARHTRTSVSSWVFSYKEEQAIASY